MDRTTADELVAELERTPDVSSASVVHFKDHGGVNFAPAETADDPEDELYGVSFAAFDAQIPQSVIKIVAGYNTQGILIHPDPGVVLPKPRSEQ